MTAIEAEGKFIEICVPMLRSNRPLIGTEEPALEE
jgi:hypothetical protein